MSAGLAVITDFFRHSRWPYSDPEEIVPVYFGRERVKKIVIAYLHRNAKVYMIRKEAYDLSFASLGELDRTAHQIVGYSQLPEDINRSLPFNGLTVESFGLANLPMSTQLRQLLLPDSALEMPLTMHLLIILLLHTLAKEPADSLMYFGQADEHNLGHVGFENISMVEFICRLFEYI